MNASNLKIKGMTWRWLINVIGVIVIVILLIQIVAIFFISDSYYSAVRSDMHSKIRMAAGFLDKYTDMTEADFELGAKEFINNYTDKDSVEILIYDQKGNVIVSSRGFVQVPEYATDYDEAVKTEQEAEWIGKTDLDEKIMAVTMPLKSSAGETSGALRLLVSLELIDRQIFYNFMIVLIAGVVVALLVSLSGVFFLRSIRKPIRAITQTAYSIAAGNFNDRLPVRQKNMDELDKLCDTINYMASELASAENLKNEFISSVSHELRTPLTVIKGWAETIRASGTSDPLILNKGVEVISNECERLSGLVEDLLDFSRMQSGHLRLHMEKTDILAELEEAYVMYKEIAAKDGIRLEYRAPEQLPPVMADANRLKQVFINIIDNAVKYSSRGGLVRIEASSHDIYVQVAVKDTGCGIAAQDLGKVKERFYKANKTVRGSGIGLAVADEIIKQHNGILEIDSKENIGTVVTIVLPIGKPDTGEQTEGETHIEQV